MYAIIDGLANLLSAEPDPVLAQARVGSRRPAALGEVPAVSVSLSIDDLRTSGFDSVIRGGDFPNTPPTDLVRGTNFRGTMSVEVWATSASELSTTSRKLQDRLIELQRMRQSGFIRLQPAGLAPLEQVQVAPPTGSPFAVWKQPLSYRFTFMAEKPPEPSDGGPIRHIDVHMQGSAPESLSIPPANP